MSVPPVAGQSHLPGPQETAGRVRERSAALFAISAATMFGVSGAIAGDVLTHVSVARAAQVRSLVAAAILLFYAWRRGAIVLRGSWWAVASFGISVSTVMGTFYAAVDRIGVGPAVTLQFLAPILVLFWMRIVERRKIYRSAWFASGVGVVGTALISQVWRGGSMDTVGVGAGLACAVSFAAYLVLGERLTRRFPPAGVMAYALLVSAIIWAFAAPPWSLAMDLPLEVWGELLWMGSLGTAIPFIFDVTALQRGSAGLVGIVSSVEPMIGGFAAWALFAQPMAKSQVLGMALVVGAVAAVQRRGAVTAEPMAPVDRQRSHPAYPGGR